MPGAPGQSYRRQMAEEIRRRVTALRLATYLAIALTIAGITSSRAPLQTVSADAASSPTGRSVPANSVGSRQVIDGSLLLGDIKAGQVLGTTQAARQFLKIKSAEETYVNKLYAADTYLKLDDAATSYIKLGSKIDASTLGGIPPSGFMLGDGSVRTGLASFTGDGQKDLLDLPGIGNVVATVNGDGHGVQLTNTSGIELVVSVDGKSSIVEAGGTAGILIGLSQPTVVQIIGPDRGLVSTLTVTVAQVGKGSLVSGQGMVGG